MMGLDPRPSAWQVRAHVRARSHAYAPTPCLEGLPPNKRTRANPSERRTLPFLPRFTSVVCSRMRTPAHEVRLLAVRELRDAGAVGVSTNNAGSPHAARPDRRLPHASLSGAPYTRRLSP